MAWFNIFSRKQTETWGAVVQGWLGQPKWTPRNYKMLAQEAYIENAVGYRCTVLIARSLAAMPWMLKRKDGSEIERHPILDLLANPNPQQSGARLTEALISHYLLAGNGYLEGVGPDNAPPRELYALRPDRMKLIPGQIGIIGFEYEANGVRRKWEVDPLTGASAILHMKAFHPTDDFYGLAAVEPAARAVDMHNAAGSWNTALLQNGARPQGALFYSGKVPLTTPQREGLRAELRAMAKGEDRGSPLMLEGDFDWKELSINPKDMDWLNGRFAAAREIALSFGVPPQLLGIPGDATYANMQEARLALYEETVLPMAAELAQRLTTWLCPSFGADLVLTHDHDQVPALVYRRESRWASVQAATFLTTNEKREALGYEPIDVPEADEILIPAGQVPLGADDMPGSLDTEPA